MKKYLQYSVTILSAALLLSAAGFISLLQLGGYVPFWIWATLGFNFLVSISLFLVAYHISREHERRKVPVHEKSRVPVHEKVKVPVQTPIQRIESPKRIVTEKVDKDVTRLKKLEALHNAVVNPAFSTLVEEDLQHIFLNFVDELTPWHMRVLKFLDDPEEWLRQSSNPAPKNALGTAASILFTAFPELEKKEDFTKQLFADLSARGLASDWESMTVITGRSGMLASRTTSIGKQFLEFVTSPPKKE